MKRIVLTLATIALAACGGGGAESPAAPSAPSNAYTAEVAACLAQANQYRASVGLAALGRSVSLEDYAVQAATHDGSVHTGHDYFRTTSHAAMA